jgi:hypothetical protein
MLGAAQDEVGAMVQQPGKDTIMFPTGAPLSNISDVVHGSFVTTPNPNPGLSRPEPGFQAKLPLQKPNETDRK